MKAVIEIGTHSVKCLRDGRDRMVITRLGSGTITREAADRTRRAVEAFLAEGPAHIVATHGLRAARNRRSVLRRWRFDVRVLSEWEEANYAYIGATGGLGRGPFLVVDVGGGSTEIASLDERISLRIGAATLTERFITCWPVPSEQRRAIDACIARHMRRVPWHRVRGMKLVAVGGTIVTVAAMGMRGEDRLEQVHGRRFNLHKIAAFGFIYSRLTPETFGLMEGRADVIHAGMRILMEAAHRTGTKHVLVSTRGVRHGVALALEK